MFALSLAAAAAVACGELLGGGGGDDPPGSSGGPSDARAEDPAVTPDALSDAGCVLPDGANVFTDPDHCGTCGRRCENGGCTNGVCAAYAFTSASSANVDSVPALAVEGDALFVADDEISGGGGGVARCSPLPGYKEQCDLGFIAIRPRIADLSVAGGRVFFAGRTDPDIELEGGVGAVAADGVVIARDAAVSPLLVGRFNGAAIAVSNGVLYAAEGAGPLHTCPATTCDDRTPVPNVSLANDLAADVSGFCFVGMRGMETGVFCGPNLAGLTRAAPTPSQAPTRVLVDGPRVFFKLGGEWKFARRNGADPATPLVAMTGMDAIAVDGATVYGIQHLSAPDEELEIRRCPMETCQTSVLIGTAESTFAARDLVVGGDHLYFFTDTLLPFGGLRRRLERVPK